MRSLPLQTSGCAILLLAVAAPAFGGRMIDSAAPPALPEATEPAATDADAETAEPHEVVPDDDVTRVAEPADANDTEIGVLRTPTRPGRSWNWTFSFTLNAFYDDNILISNSDKESDEILKTSVNLGFTWGDYLKKKDNFLMVQYAPSWLFFADHSNYNGFEQVGTMVGQWRTGKFTFGGVFGLQTTTGGDIDVGARANLTMYNFELRAKYDYNEKTSAEVNLFRNASDYAVYRSSVEWVDQNWVDYQMSPKARLGLGLTLGDLIPKGSAAQTYEQALGRFYIPATSKLEISASGGMEVRQLGGGAGTQTKPVFRIGASYAPANGTNLSLEASRANFSAAALDGADFTATQVTLTARQRLGRRFALTLAGGYEDAQYEGTGSTVGITRHDKYLFVRPAISMSVSKRLVLELYYKYRRNNSTELPFSFDNNIIGLQATLSF